MADLVEVTQFTRSLLEELVEIERENFGEGGLNEWTLPVVAKYGKVFIFKEGEDIKGLAELIRDWSDSQLAFLIGISLKKKHQNKGLGKIFLEKLLAQLGGTGIIKVRLTVSLENRNALNLYKKFGFKKIKFSPDEYGKGEDRLILETKLSKF